MSVALYKAKNSQQKETKSGRDGHSKTKKKSFKISASIKMHMSEARKKMYAPTSTSVSPDQLTCEFVKKKYYIQTHTFHHLCELRAECSLRFGWIYLSALHDHNYRLPKLIISSRLMCWRLFVIFFSFCGQRVLRSCALAIRAKYLIVLKRSIKKRQTKTKAQVKQKKKSSL